jgi:hypothetical protein
MRWLACLVLAACRIGFDEVAGTDATTASDDSFVCSGTVCVASCPADTTCAIDCGTATECIVDCDGPCTVTDCDFGRCVVRCDGELTQPVDGIATCP